MLSQWIKFLPGKCEDLSVDSQASKAGYAGVCNLIQEPVKGYQPVCLAKPMSLRFEKNLQKKIKTKTNGEILLINISALQTPVTRMHTCEYTQNIHTHSKIFVIPSVSTQRRSPKQLILPSQVNLCAVLNYKEM